MIRAAVAQGWGSAVAKACKQPFPDCSRCRRPESKEQRVSWGCDAEAPRAVWESSCHRCTSGDPECALCSGSGQVPRLRCPSSMVAEAPVGMRLHLDLLMRAYSHYDRRNVLPSRGAWLDQSRSFLAGVDLIDAERAYWDSMRIEHDQLELERSKKISQPQRRAP